MNSLFCRGCIVNEQLLKFLFWAAALTVSTLYCLYLTHRNFKKARLIEDMPTSFVRSASQGYTELIGVAKVYSQQLIAPLTNRPCLWWSYSIEQYKKSGKYKHWVTIESGSSEKPFYIDDNTGLCLIQPVGADLTPRHKRRWRGRHRRPLAAGENETTGSVARWLTLDIGIGASYRYTEHLIIEGDPLYTLGHFESDSTGQRIMSADKMAGKILRTWKKDFVKLLEDYDSNSDGQLDLMEWKIVQDAAKNQALLQRQAQGEKPVSHQLGKPAERGLPFLIASGEQINLSKRYRLQALAFGIGFLVLGAMATWYINARSM